ncbi:MAG: hypothetical protein HPY82_26920 [Gammaproteobacteria bacterium]|nr:hypothetical protein [Gammaproteobacteria bacterium]
MDYSQIIDALNHASGFDLYRLRSALENMIDEPRRLIEIRALLRVGQRVQWFDVGRNRLCEGTLINIKQTRAVISNPSDGKRWDIPLCAINIHQVDTQIESQRPVAALTKNEIQIGERVGFVDGDGIERSGEMIRLNQKTATAVNHADRISWRVSYALL